MMLGDDDDFDELENDELDDADDDEEEDGDSTDDDLTDIGGDTVVGLSGEFNIDDLVAKLDSTDPAEIARRRAIRRRLEEIREMRDADLDSTFNFRFDDEDD
jgi:hypothetical protein